MKIFLTIILVTAAGVIFSQKKTINVTFTYIQPYCGGARPSEEMLREAEKPKPYSNKTVMCVSTKGRIDSAKTDENGKARFKLKKGSYLVYESWRYYLYTPFNIPIESFDRECLKSEWQKATCKIVVDRKAANVVGLHPIVVPCSWNAPCLLEQGPVPQ
jgi:hypothetical protein